MSRMIPAIILMTLIHITLAAYAQTIRSAPLPMQDQETVVKQFWPMTTYLEQRLGVTVVYVYLNSYADICRRPV